LLLLFWLLLLLQLVLLLLRLLSMRWRCCCFSLALLLALELRLPLLVLLLILLPTLLVTMRSPSAAGRNHPSLQTKVSVNSGKKERKVLQGGHAATLQRTLGKSIPEEEER
jgi:hypothetical protein